MYKLGCHARDWRLVMDAGGDEAAAVRPNARDGPEPGFLYEREPPLQSQYYNYIWEIREDNNAQ